MRSLSEFSEEKINNENQITENEIKDSYEKYKDLSEDELLKELFMQVEKQKKNGSFDFENLKNLVDSLKPMLSNEQLQNINTLLDRIK